MRKRLQNIDIKRIILMVLFFAGLSASKILSQDMPVPINLQAVLFKKILLYDNTPTGTKKIIVLGNSGQGKDVVDAFTAAGLPAELVTDNKIPNNTGVIYLMPGTPSPTKVCEDNNILSISGVPAFAEDGHVSISLGIEDGKPQIILNLARLRKEGHILSPDLIYLSKLIK